MVAANYRLIGRGVYSLREAERLAQVPRRRIRRWVTGYEYAYRGGLRYSPPVVETEQHGPNLEPIITFRDLLEIRFLNAFRDHGVSWYAIKVASERARELLSLDHPFSSRKFKTDGRTIMAELVSETGDEQLLDLVRSQWVFAKIIGGYLYDGIEFDDSDEPQRWWPLGESHHVVIDPVRSFGAPIVPVEGVRTRILADAIAAEGSIEAAAEIYEVDPSAVGDAYLFELSTDA